MEPSRANSVSYKLPPSFMTYFHPFRRCILLLLSLTLSTQALAVASMGACHRMKALTAVHQMVAPTAHQHASAAAHHDGSMHHAGDHGKAPTGDDTRVSCAACAACHLCSIILNNVTVAADVPVEASTRFPNIEVPRARNVASGLERPPRA